MCLGEMAKDAGRIARGDDVGREVAPNALHSADCPANVIDCLEDLTSSPAAELRQERKSLTFHCELNCGAQIFYSSNISEK